MNVLYDLSEIWELPREKQKIHFCLFFFLLEGLSMYTKDRAIIFSPLQTHNPQRAISNSETKYLSAENVNTAQRGRKGSDHATPT